MNILGSGIVVLDIIIDITYSLSEIDVVSKEQQGIPVVTDWITIFLSPIKEYGELLSIFQFVTDIIFKLFFRFHGIFSSFNSLYK